MTKERLYQTLTAYGYNTTDLINYEHQILFTDKIIYTHYIQVVLENDKVNSLIVDESIEVDREDKKLREIVKKITRIRIQKREFIGTLTHIIKKENKGENANEQDRTLLKNNERVRR